MFLHLGGDYVVDLDRVIAILDLESCGKGTSTRQYINSTVQEGKIEYICEPGKEKSFVITTEKAYYSPISSMTLLKRSASFSIGEASVSDLNNLDT